MDAIPRDDDLKDKDLYNEFVTDLVDECAAAIERDGGEGQHDADFLVRELVENAVFEQGIAKAAFILLNSNYEVDEWEPFVGSGAFDVGANEAMAYSKVKQEVVDDLQRDGYEIHG